MMEYKHIGMIRFFMGEKSQYAKECYKGHGIRPTEMPPDMYLTLKPLPQELMDNIRTEQSAKIKRIAQAKREALQKENEAKQR